MYCIIKDNVIISTSDAEPNHDDLASRNEIAIYNDIASIILTYEDNTEKEIFMKWSGNENNNLQHTSMIEDKLHISID